MKEKILVPLDGSRVGEAALPYVEDLVAKFLPEPKVEVTLMQVLSSLSHYVVAGEASARIPFTEQEIKQMENAAASYLRKAGRGLKDKGAKISVKVAVGNAAEEIIKTADELNVDFIAMSSHGRSGLSRWAFGSVTDRVVRGGNKPVLVVKAPKDAQ
jgi:nucleotide-binding universal stress UspA family protein